MMYLVILSFKVIRITKTNMYFKIISLLWMTFSLFNFYAFPPCQPSFKIQVSTLFARIEGIRTNYEVDGCPRSNLRYLYESVGYVQENAPHQASPAPYILCITSHMDCMDSVLH